MRFVLPRPRLVATLLALMTGVASPVLVRAQAAPATTAVQAPDSTGAPVIVAGDTLFVLHARIGAFTPVERADGVMRRADALARTIARGTDSIVVVEAETHTDLVVGETVLMTVLDGDARPLGVARSDLAAQWSAALSGGMEAQAKRTSWQTILLGVLFALIATGALVLLLKGLALVFPRLITRVDGWRNTVIPALRIQRLEVLSSGRLTDFVLGVIRTARIVLTVIVLYFYVPLVLRFFP